MAKLIYEALRELREERGLSRSALSRKTPSEGDEGVAEKTIEALESTPGRLPDARVIEALARALDVEPAHFYEWPIAEAAAGRRATRPSVTERAKQAAQRLDGTQPTSQQRRGAQGEKDRGA